MGFALKKPDDAAGAAWPAIVIGLFVAFVSGRSQGTQYAEPSTDR